MQTQQTQGGEKNVVFRSLRLHFLSSTVPAGEALKSILLFGGEKASTAAPVHTSGGCHRRGDCGDAERFVRERQIDSKHVPYRRLDQAADWWPSL